MLSYKITTIYGEIFINADENHIDRLVANKLELAKSHIYTFTEDQFSILLKSGSVKEITYLNESGNYPNVVVTNVWNKERKKENNGKRTI